MAGPPVDLSFFDVVSMDELLYRRPRRSVAPYLVSESGRYYCEALRLNNNGFSSTCLLPTLCSRFLEHPEALAWIDLSCNELHKTPCELLCLPGLRLLYLHGNRLTNLQSLLDVLSQLPSLFGLTLHGNPLPQDYRQVTLATLTRLRALDFNNVTLVDRHRAVRALCKQPVMWHSI